ncbi:MAG: DUF2079 domain-containing protein [Candidatus Dormibacteraeota bacterium]|nr:DUF2079 domain-containing protein [Candidatus Dormibacteraeota bacterium]
MSRLRDFLTRRQGWVVLALAILYFLVYATLAVLRHESYHSWGFDLGLNDQVIWNTTQGRPFESTMSLVLAYPHSYLGDHFAPIYLLVVPFYMAFPHPETLVVFQSMAFALGVWPVYLLARLKLPDGYPLVWAVAYFLFPSVAFITLWDFHDIALSVAPLGFALYFLERERKGWFVLSLLVSFAIKEEMPLIGAGIGAYALLGKRNWKLGLGVLAGSLLAFATLLQVVLPYFLHGRSYSYIRERYAEVGGSPGAILLTLLTKPLQVAHVLLVPKKLFFSIGIFGPVLGISWLAGWASLLLLPTLGYILLSNDVKQYSLVTQYPAPLIPLVFGTAILGFARFRESARLPLAVAVLASSLLFSFAFGDMPFSLKFDASQFRREPRYAAFMPQLAVIPSDARVSAEGGITSHLSERRYIYDYWWEGVQDADWVVLDSRAVNYDLRTFESQVTSVESHGYEQVASGQGLMLLRKARG